MLRTPTTFVGSTNASDATSEASFGVATPGRVVALSTHVPNSIVSRYLQNPVPLDPTMPDVQSSKAPVLIVRLYSIVNSGDAAPRSHQASYLSIIEDVFQIIIEEGGDILQVTNGADIVAVWNESDEELSTVIRRVALCAQKIRMQLQQKIACLADSTNAGNNNSNNSSINNNSSSMTNSYSMSNSINIPTTTVSSIGNNISMNNHNNNNNSFLNYGYNNNNHNSNNNNNNSNINNSYSTQHNLSIPNSSNLFGTTLKGTMPTPSSIPIPSTPTSSSSSSSSFINHHNHQSSYSNGYNNSFNNSNSNIYNNNVNNSYSNNNNHISSSNYNNSNSFINNYPNPNNLNLPTTHHSSSTTSTSFFNSSNNISSNSQQPNYSGSPNINSGINNIGSSNSTTTANSASVTTNSNPNPCNDPLFNIFLGCGEFFTGSIGGENNSWLVLLGGDALMCLNKIIKLYEQRYCISSFPVKLSLGRVQPVKNSTNLQQQRLKNLVHSSPQMLSVSPAGGGVSGGGSTLNIQQSHLNRVFGQIIIGSETFQHIRCYSQCELVMQEYNRSDNQQSLNNLETNSTISATTTSTTTQQSIYLLRQIQELSKPVGISVEKQLKDISPEHMIAMHKLLWCHLPIHVKVLASSLMSTNTIHPSMEQFRLTQDWSLETRNVTFLILHFFNLSYKWDTINFFHPIIIKLQEIMRKTDGTVTDIIQKTDGVFVVCAMGLPPFSSDNHSVAGVKNAMDIGRMMQTHPKYFIRDVNILVLTEKIVCGLVGNKTRSEYVVIGEKIHHATQWLSTVRSQTTLSPSGGGSNDEDYPSSSKQVSEGGWVLCDDATRKACDKAITFDTVNYDIQFPLAIVKFRTGLIDPSSNMVGGVLKKSYDHTSNLYNTTPTPTVNPIMENHPDDEVSVTFSLKSSVNSDLSMENNTPLGHHSHSFEGDKHDRVSFHCLPWTQHIATMITHRPLGIAHIPTTMDHQANSAYLNNNNNSNNETSIVGRKKELSTILNRYSHLTERLTSSFTLIEADIGLGKSSLVTEIYKQCNKEGAQVLCGSCSLLEKSKAYNVWTGVFSDLFFSEFSLGETRFAASGEKQQYRLLSWTRYKHVQSMPPEQIRQYIFQKFTDRRPELLPLLSLLNPVLRIDFPPNEITAQYMSSSALLLDKTFELLSYFLRLTASRRRLVIILEDIHYMDPVSWSLLLQISFTIRPVMIIATSRQMKDRPKELTRIMKTFSPPPPKESGSPPPSFSDDDDSQTQTQTQSQPQTQTPPQQTNHHQQPNNNNMNFVDNVNENEQKQQQQQQTKSNLITPLSFEYYEMQLQALPPSAIREIIKRQLGAKIVSNNVYQLIQFKSEGNPFVCIEMTKNLREREYLIVREDRCFVQPIHFTRGFPSISECLESFYLSKVNHLTNIFSIILKAASVMGLYIFPYPLIHLLYPIGSKRPFLRDILHRLVEAGLLVSTKRNQLSSEFLFFPPPSSYHQTNFNRSMFVQNSNGGLPNVGGGGNGGIGNSFKDLSTSMKITSIIGGFNNSISQTMQHSSFKLPPLITDDIEDSDEESDEFLQSSSNSLKIDSLHPLNDNSNSGGSKSKNSQHHQLRHSTNFGQSLKLDPSPKLMADQSFSLGGGPKVLNIVGEDDWNQYYGFKSPLLQEAMYNSLLPAQRHSLHQKIAKWIEETYTADELPSYNELLADHWSKTDMSFQENLSKALQHTFMAGEDASNRFDYLDMIKYHSEFISIFKNHKNGSVKDQGRRPIPYKLNNSPMYSNGDTDEDDLLEPLAVEMNNEERLKYVISMRRIAEGYTCLGYFEHAEQYFLHALHIVKEPPPKPSSTLVVSVLTQVTKQNFFKFASKNKQFQVYTDSYLSPSAALSFETACIYSSLVDYYFKGTNLSLALYCAMHAVQGLEAHQSAPVWMAGPEMALAYARLSLITSVYPFCGSVSPSLGKQAMKIIDDLMNGYMQIGNSMAVNNLMTAIGTLGVRDVYLGSWDRVEDIIRKCTDLFDRFPNSYIKDRDLILFVFVSYRLIKGELNMVHAIIDECLAHNLGSMTWMATLTFYHMKALTFTLQGKYMDAYQVILDAENSRPNTEGIEMILQHAITASIFSSRGEITKALDEISSVTPLIGNKPGCGIRIIYAYDLICKVLLSIVEKDRFKPPVHVKTSIVINDTSIPSKESSSSHSANDSKDFVAFEAIPFQSATALPKMYSLKELKRRDSISTISNTPSPHFNPELIPTVSPIINNSNINNNNNNINPNETTQNVGGNNSSNNSSPTSNVDSSQPLLMQTINGVQIFVDDNYNGGKSSNSSRSSNVNVPNYDLDIQEIEMWIKKILNEIKLMEKITPFSTSCYNRLSGVSTIVFQYGSACKQRGLSLLYKSAKESKINGLPLEEALAWHEISKYEDIATHKQQFAWKSAQDLYQRMGIDTWTLNK